MFYVVLNPFVALKSNYWTLNNRTGLISFQFFSTVAQFLFQCPLFFILCIIFISMMLVWSKCHMHMFVCLLYVVKKCLLSQGGQGKLPQELKFGLAWNRTSLDQSPCLLFFTHSRETDSLLCVLSVSVKRQWSWTHRVARFLVQASTEEGNQTSYEDYLLLQPGKTVSRRCWFRKGVKPDTTMTLYDKTSITFLIWNWVIIM